jgi:hypothetical protein
MTDLTSCPDCGALAEIVDRDVLESTDGPVEHARVRCLTRHVFFLPTARLARPPAAASRRTTPARGRR